MQYLQVELLWLDLHRVQYHPRPHRLLRQKEKERKAKAKARMEKVESLPTRMLLAALRQQDTT